MGLLMSQIERQQFVQLLRMARNAGWSGMTMARALKVGAADLENMVNGFKIPSPKHVRRLGELVRSSPPKRVLPPAPSQPLVPPPPFEAVRAVGDRSLVGRESDPPATNTVEPTAETLSSKEIADMQARSSPNGVQNGAGRTQHKDNARYQLLPKKEASDLRRHMLSALTTHFNSSIPVMADAIGVTPNGLRKLLTKTKGSISIQTQQMFKAALSRDRKPISSITEVRKGKGSTQRTVSKIKTKAKANPESSSESGAEPSSQPVDLYQLAGKLLAQGCSKQAQILSLVALLSESIAAERLLKALEALLPFAAVG